MGFIQDTPSLNGHALRREPSDGTIVMLPPVPPIENHAGIAHPKFEQRRRAVQQTLVERIERARSQKAFAKTIGKSDATLIAFKNGAWATLSEDMLRQFEAALQIDGNWSVMQTRNLQAVEALCADALRYRRLVAVSAATGLGKTTGLKGFARATGAAYVLCHSLHRPGSLLADILQALGLSGGASVADRLGVIVSFLQRAEVPLLILDDCGKLANPCFPIIQLIYDLTEGSAGIVLGGTEHLRKVIELGCRYDYKGFRELNRRIGYWQPLYHPTAQEVRGFASAHGITDGPAVNWLVGNTTDFGSLRNYVENAVRKARELDEPVTRELLNDLHVGDFDYKSATR